MSDSGLVRLSGTTLIIAPPDSKESIIQGPTHRTCSTTLRTVSVCCGDGHDAVFLGTILLEVGVVTNTTKFYIGCNRELEHAIIIDDIIVLIDDVPCRPEVIIGKETTFAEGAGIYFRGVEYTKAGTAPYEFGVGMPTSACIALQTPGSRMCNCLTL